jgi:hypothetical protein
MALSALEATLSGPVDGDQKSSSFAVRLLTVVFLSSVAPRNDGISWMTNRRKKFASTMSVSEHPVRRSDARPMRPA